MSTLHKDNSAMAENVKHKCIRCVVHIHLAKVDWQDNDGVSVILDGPSVFVRACVLGQLQHTRLHSASFPLIIHHTLTFDRVLTNCRDSNLFKEVIRGEHIKFELIQITSDFGGGKILARFDAPAHKFLFPDSPSEEELQQIVLNKSRKYQHPPRLSYTCSTSLSEVSVQSPLESLCEESSTFKNKYGRNQPKMATSTPFESFHASTVGRSCDGDDPHDVEHPQTKLHSLLDSYLEPSKAEPNEKKTPYQVKFKPPVPKFSQPKTQSQVSHSSTLHTSTPPHYSQLYQSTTTKLGPHEWAACPRRSPKRQRSYSAPSSPVRKVRFTKRSHGHSESVRPSSGDWDRSLALSDLEDSPDDEVTDTRPPFVVRHPDPHLMEKRDFCGCSFANTTNTSSRLSTENRGSNCESVVRQSPVKRSQAEDSIELEGSLPAYLNDSLRMGNEDYSPSGRLSSRIHSPSVKLQPYTVVSTAPPPEMLPSQGYVAPRTSYSASSCIGKRDLVSRYLVSHPGNVRSGVDSPGKVIKEKIERLKTECCDCKHDADSLGEDDLSEDLDRLRASLQAERDEYLDHTARLIPQDNVTVKIGPRDYWSRRMSEFTGKKHRLLFDETLEKIYNKLYTDASHSV